MVHSRRSSRTYRFSMRLRGLWLRLIPPGSRRSTLGHFVVRVTRRVRQGPKFFQAAVRRVAIRIRSLARRRWALMIPGQPLAGSTVSRHRHGTSGRDAEREIATRAGLLARPEPDRFEDDRRPWTLVVDATTKQRLGGTRLRSHRLVDWESGLPAQPLLTDRAEQVLYLIGSAHLRKFLAEGGLTAAAIIAVWYDAIDDAYECRVEAVQLGVIAFTDRIDVAERLEMLGVDALVVDSGQSLLDLTVQYANRRVEFGSTCTESPRLGTSPQPSESPGGKHILIQLDDFHQGGLENVVLGLAHGLRRRGSDISLLVLRRQGPAVDQARRSGIEVVTIPRRHRDRFYRELLLERKVDVVNAHFSTFGAGIAAGLGIPFVQVVHNAYVWLDERAIDDYREADHATSGYICVSAEVARYCDSRLGLSVSKMSVVPNGIDGPRLDAAREQGPAELRDELGLCPDDFVFLNVASIHATKGQKVLVKALASLITAHPKARLVIAGSASDPEYEWQLRRMIRQYGLERKVVLAGQRHDVARFYWMADAFVLPSYWEGWSLALTEAVYTGLPAVATDVGGARELLSQGGGWLVKPPFSSISELNARTIARLVRGEDDQLVGRLADSMSRASSLRRRILVAEQTKRLLDQEHMIDRHKTILDGFIQGGNAAAVRAWSRATRTLRKAISRA